MKKEELAKKLDGREYGSEITEKEKRQAKDSRLVVVFGCSDDNVELAGAIEDEIGAWEGTTLLIHDGEVMTADHKCDCEFCTFKTIKQLAKKIEVKWDHNDYSWWFETEIPHATFNVFEDGEKFCRGIVFCLDDVK